MMLSGPGCQLLDMNKVFACVYIPFGICFFGYNNKWGCTVLEAVRWVIVDRFNSHMLKQKVELHARWL